MSPSTPPGDAGPDDATEDAPDRAPDGPGGPEAAAQARTEDAPGMPAEDAPDLADVLGGRRGLFDTGAPGALFVLLYTAGSYWWPGEALRYALWAALAAAGALAVVRTLRRESLRETLMGLFGVALGAFLASRTGNAANFYLPGLLIQAAYAVAYLASVLVGWPLIGVFAGPLLGEGMSWRADPARRRTYRRATWLWVAMFALRILVQLPLYLAGATVALGVARLVMGWPLFALVAWLTYALVRAAPPPQQHLADADGRAAD